MRKYILTIVMSVVSLSMMASSLADGLVGYWPFDDDANDASGNGNHGVVHGASLTNGKYGGAYYFDGSSSITVADSASLRNIDSAITIAVWIKPTAWFINSTGGKSKYIVVLAKEGSSSQQYALAYERPEVEWLGDFLSLNYWIGAVVNNVRMPTLGSWQFIVVTLSGGKIRHYYNGSLSETADVGASLTPISDGALYIGMAPRDRCEYFIGYMDELCIYNRALSASEINALYSGALRTAKTCTVTYHSNNGTGTMESQTFEADKEQKLSKCLFKKDGFVFQGWVSDSVERAELAASGVIDVDYTDEQEITVDHDMTLYAVWANPPLTLTAESADWSSGSITLRCEDVDQSGAEHTYTLEYCNENGTWVAVDDAQASVTKGQNANGEEVWVVRLMDTGFSSRLGGLQPVEYRVKDENERVSGVCQTRNRYALVVGIDKYSSETMKNLYSCVSDAKGWETAFTDWGRCRLIYPPITDAAATKETIMQKLNNCAKQTKPGDTFFYAHSGHGDVGILRTYNSIKVLDSKGNAIVGPEDITANEFASAMMEFPKGVGVVVILDTCSSGSIPFTNKRSHGRLMSTPIAAESRSFAESVMVAMNTRPMRLLSTAGPSNEDEPSYPKISSGDEIGWLTAVDPVQDSRDGVFSQECLQTAGWQYGGADYDNDGMVDFYELGRFAKYWLGRTFDQYGMTPQTFSMNILSSIRAGCVSSSGHYSTLSAPVIGTPVNGAYHVTFKWSAVAGANDYCVAWITNNFTNFCSTAALSEKIGPLKPGTVVSAYIKARNPMDVSDHSQTATGVVEYNVAVEEQVRECDWTSICPASANPINGNGTIDYDKLDLDHDGDGMSSFHEFIAGSDPLDIQSKFEVKISLEETGEPKIEWSPDTPELRATRVYRTLGKKSLTDPDWVDITDMDQTEYRFFKVAVELDDGDGGGNVSMDDFVIEQGVLQRYVGDAINVSIPSCVTNIGEYAFAGNTNLVSVTIPGSVTNVGDYAFAYCEGLTSVTFNGNAPSIGDSCFGWGAPSCTVYVKRGSSGWGVSIPGTWNGMAIRFKEDDE